MVVLLLGLFFWPPSSANAGQTSLALVSARDHIEGSMAAPQSVYADETRIYLATSQLTQGTLFVLGRDRVLAHEQERFVEGDVRADAFAIQPVRRFEMPLFAP